MEKVHAWIGWDNISFYLNESEYSDNMTQEHKSRLTLGSNQRDTYYKFNALSIELIGWWIYVHRLQFK